MAFQPLDLTALEAELTENDRVDSSAAALLTSILADVEAANVVNAAAVQSVVDRWRTSTQALAAAVAQVTPPPPAASKGKQ